MFCRAESIPCESIRFATISEPIADPAGGAVRQDERNALRAHKRAPLRNGEEKGSSNLYLEPLRNLTKALRTRVNIAQSGPRPSIIFAVSSRLPTQGGDHGAMCLVGKKNN